MDAPHLLGLTLEEARSALQAGHPDIKLKIVYYSSPVIKKSLAFCDRVYRVVRQKALGSNEIELTVSLFRAGPEKNH